MLENNDKKSYDSWNEAGYYPKFSYPNQPLKTPGAPKVSTQKIYESESNFSLDLSLEYKKNKSCFRFDFPGDKGDSSDEDYDDASSSNILSNNQDKISQHQNKKNHNVRAYTYVKAECLGPKVRVEK